MRGLRIILELMVLQGKGHLQEKDVVSSVLNFDYSSVVASLSVAKKEESTNSGEFEDIFGKGNELLTLSQVGYGSESGLDHMKLWYGGQGKTKIEGEEEELYKKGQDVSDVSQMMLSVPEAEETLKDIQYATALGAYHDVDVRTREKFSLWVMFNPALLGLFEASHKITGNVDYSKTV